ncbi:MAG: GNAT family N-acetyltransferase [Gemmatimonadales bacterium]
MTAAAQVRPARPEEAAALATLMERTFRDTFGAANTPGDLALHCRTHYAPDIQAAELADPAFSTLVADLGGSLAAFAQLQSGETPAEVAGADPIQLARFYVDQAWHGRGLAQQLMAAALAAARARGARTVWLGVWEKNPRGIAFYRKEGFREVGMFDFFVGTDRQRDFIMARPLD